MKKEKLSFSTITDAEVWQPSLQLRWFEFNQRFVSVGNFGDSKIISERKLQQLFTSNLGNREWKDIPIETES